MLNCGHKGSYLPTYCIAWNLEVSNLALALSTAAFWSPAMPFSLSYSTGHQKTYNFTVLVVTHILPPACGCTSGQPSWQPLASSSCTGVEHLSPLEPHSVAEHSAQSNIPTLYTQRHVRLTWNVLTWSVWWYNNVLARSMASLRHCAWKSLSSLSTFILSCSSFSSRSSLACNFFSLCPWGVCTTHYMNTICCRYHTSIVFSQCFTIFCDCSFLSSLRCLASYCSCASRVWWLRLPLIRCHSAAWITVTCTWRHATWAACNVWEQQSVPDKVLRRPLQHTQSGRELQFFYRLKNTFCMHCSLTLQFSLTIDSWRQ